MERKLQQEQLAQQLKTELERESFAAQNRPASADAFANQIRQGMKEGQNIDLAQLEKVRDVAGPGKGFWEDLAKSMGKDAPSQATVDMILSKLRGQ